MLAVFSYLLESEFLSAFDAIRLNVTVNVNISVNAWLRVVAPMTVNVYSCAEILILVCFKPSSPPQ